VPVLRWILPHADTRDLRWSGFGQMVFGGLSLTLQVGREKRRRAVGQECYFHTSIRVPCRTPERRSRQLLEAMRG